MKSFITALVYAVAAFAILVVAFDAKAENLNSEEFKNFLYKQKIMAVQHAAKDFNKECLQKYTAKDIVHAANIYYEDMDKSFPITKLDDGRTMRRVADPEDVIFLLLMERCWLKN